MPFFKIKNKKNLRHLLDFSDFTAGAIIIASHIALNGNVFRRRRAEGGGYSRVRKVGILS